MLREEKEAQKEISFLLIKSNLLCEISSFFEVFSCWEREWDDDDEI